MLVLVPMLVMMQLPKLTISTLKIAGTGKYNASEGVCIITGIFIASHGLN